jgi:hypothetical protein
MKWHRANSLQKKKFKAAPSANKVMVTIFCDMERVILMDIMAKETTINSET